LDHTNAIRTEVEKHARRHVVLHYVHDQPTSGTAEFARVASGTQRRTSTEMRYRHLAMNQKSVFWSWQSWQNQRATRNYIEEALKRALDSIAETNFEIARRPEQDARGTSGAVDISQEILVKIRRASVVVADVTNIARQTKQKLTPNPNVLFEAGFAEGVLSEKRVILVANERYGVPDAMPFDLRNRSIIYFNDEGHASHSDGIKKLAGRLQARIEEALTFAIRPLPLSIEIEDGVGSREISGGSDSYRYKLRLENTTPRKLGAVRCCVVEFQPSDERKKDDSLPAGMDLEIVTPNDHLSTFHLKLTWHDVAEMKSHAVETLTFASDRPPGTRWENLAALAVVLEGEPMVLFQLTTKAHIADAHEYDRHRSQYVHLRKLFYAVSMAPIARPKVTFHQVLQR
jgi:hypothetical protein